MKCTSCVSSHPKSDDEEASPSPVPVTTTTMAMDKIEEEDYRVESPPTVPERPSTSRGQPAVSIVEVPPDYRGDKHSPSPSSSSHRLRPLDVITEETSDVSDSECRPTQRKPDLCFPRPKARFKKAKSRNLLKNLLQAKQEPTTCFLMEAKIVESAPEEYRSVCTTEIAPEEIMEVEVIDLGSNSSSLADLTDIDDLEEPVETKEPEEPSSSDVIERDDSDVRDDEDKINNNDQQQQSSDGVDGANVFCKLLLQDDNDNDNEPNAQAASGICQSDEEIDLAATPQPDFSPDEGDAAQIEGEDVLSEEDNNGYDNDGGDRESKTSENFTQPPEASTQNDDGNDHIDDDDDADDDGNDYQENDRTESDRDDDVVSGSLLAGVDRAGVVTQRPNVSEVKECIDDDDELTGSSDCCVTHPAVVCEEDQPVIGDSVVGQSSEMVKRQGEVPGPPPPVPVPPPPAAAMPTAVAAASNTEAVVAPPPPLLPVTNLGQDVTAGLNGSAHENAQILSGSDTVEVDHADADQNSEEGGGDAVEVQSDSSVLLKILKDQQPTAEASVENRPTFDEQQNSPPTAEKQSHSAAGTKIERTVKSEQLNYEIVQDHRVLREEHVTSTTTSRSTSSNNNNNNGGSTGGSEVILRRRGSRNNESTSGGKEPSPEQKAALVVDLRNEISRIKDAELQEEFRKLELEAARIEEELNKMAVVPPPAENLTYYVSKQNDFAVERPAPQPIPQPQQKPPVLASPSKSNGGSVPKAPSNDQLYSEWQQKMEEREARRLHKVIKISKPNDSPNNGNSNNETISLPPPPEDPDLGDEFIRKVKERRRKFTIPAGGDSDYDSGTSAPNSAPATPIATRKPIPKHIEAEFAVFAELRRRQREEEEDVREQEHDLRQAKAVESHQQWSRQNINQAESSRQQRQPKAVPAPSIPVSVASSVANGINGNGSDGEPVKVSALIEVHQQKQRELLRQDSYKTAVKSVASSVEAFTEEEEPSGPVSVSAKCQQFERKLQRSASGDGRKLAVKPNSSAPSSFKASSAASNGGPGSNRTGSYSDDECLVMSDGDDRDSRLVVAVNRNADNTPRNTVVTGDGLSNSNTNNTNNRRSFSEADLLHEIDRALVLAKDFLYARGNVELRLASTIKKRSEKCSVFHLRCPACLFVFAAF